MNIDFSLSLYHTMLPVLNDSTEERQNFRLVQIETYCRRHYKVHLK